MRWGFLTCQPSPSEAALLSRAENAARRFLWAKSLRLLQQQTRVKIHDDATCPVLLILLALLGVAGCCAPWSEPPLQITRQRSAPYSDVIIRVARGGDGRDTDGSLTRLFWPKPSIREDDYERSCDQGRILLARRQIIGGPYLLSYARTLGPSSPPPSERLIEDAKANLSSEGLASPPFDGITFEIRDP
jgi:hypothetical protein